MSPVLTRYDLAGPAVTAFSTTRRAGYSRGAYGRMNINPYCGDAPEHVAANRRLLAESLGVAESRLVVPHQVHGTVCRVVDESLFGLSAEARTAVLEGADALLTNCRGTCIGVSTADCIPVLLYDRAHHAAAAIHAGWRGTVQRIVERAVGRMNEAYHTQPQDLMAVIGPGISLARFEVGQEVYDAFAQAGHDMARIARRQDKWHIDLPLCNRLQLEQAGLHAEHITMSGICTYDRVDDYFSARRLGTASGRIYTGIVLH